MNYFEIKKKANQTANILVTKILQNISMKSTDQKFPQLVKQFSKNLSLDKLKENLQNFPLHKSAFSILTIQFNAWKKSYADIIQKHPEFINKNLNIQQFLLNFQDRVKINLNNVLSVHQLNKIYEEVQRTYNVEINIGRVTYKWSKQFIQQWRKLKWKYVGEMENKKRNEKIQRKTKKQQQSKDKDNKNNPISEKKKISRKTIQIIQIIQESKFEDFKIIDKRKKKEPIQVINQIQKKVNQNQQISTFTYRNKSLKISYQFKVKRLKNIQKYLLGRKDLTIQSNVVISLAEYLNKKLQQFMKLYLTKTIEYAKLHTGQTNNARINNEFTYFSKNNNDLQFTNSVKIADNVKLMKLVYGNKIQIYNQIQYKQVQEEDKLQKIIRKLNLSVNLTSIRDRQTNYLVTHRNKQSSQKKKKLIVEKSHIQIVLDQSQWFKDSVISQMLLI